MKITILTVGPCKNKHIRTLIDTYLSRCNRQPLVLQELVIPSTSQERVQEKIQSYCKEHPSSVHILLDEKGTEYTSTSLSSFLQRFASQSEEVTFIIGDAAGFDNAFKQGFSHTLALSTMTFPHEIAYLLLTEQLYRVKTLWENRPYHKE